MKRYTPDDGFDNAYLQAEEDGEQLPSQPVYLCSDVDPLISAARDIVAYNNDPGDCPCKGCEIIRRIRAAI